MRAFKRHNDNITEEWDAGDEHASGPVLLAVVAERLDRLDLRLIADVLKDFFAC